MNEAMNFITQALNDYAATLPLSVRGPFVATANRAVMELKQALDGQATPDASPAE